VYRERAAALEAGRARLERLTATPPELARAGFHVKQDGVRRSAFDLLRFPNITQADLVRYWPELAGWSAPVMARLAIDAQYSAYLDRQEADIRAFQRDESLALPAELDYRQIPSLSTEIREKLDAARPATLGAAARIPGVTPAAVTALLRYVRRRDSDAHAA
jgi:tRNA uridine 5-carboxymethylaminomethyl modification enzyme